MIKEKQFRKNNEFSECIRWLNDKTAREGKDYMLVVTDLFDHQKYPVFCTSALLEEMEAKYDNMDKMSRVDIVVQLQSQQEQERYTTKAYLKAFAERKRQERQATTTETSNQDDTLTR